MDNKKDFATTGTESFTLPEEIKANGKVILNVQESNSKGIILSKRNLSAFEPSGNKLVDIYRRINFYFLSNSNVKIKDKANFFHLLSVMLNAGIPMVASLKALVAQLSKSQRLQMVIKDIYEDIESGFSLSRAMMPFTKIFTESEIGMVESGEATGQLTRVLENLASDSEKSYAIKAKVKSAMIYPIVIIVLLIAVVSVMMIYVIPKLKELFDATKGDLPLVTKIVVGTSDFMINHGLLITGTVLSLVLFIMIFKKTDQGKYILDDILLKIPIFGKLFMEAYLSRFARSLSNLLDSNLSIVKTLEITANSVGNEVYRKRLLLATEDIKQGIPLAENLNSSNLFPPMLVNMIDVGEKTAQLGEITAKVAEFYEKEVDTAVEGISKIIEPVILIIIGTTVGIVVAAVMLPIMKLADLSGAL